MTSSSSLLFQRVLRRRRRTRNSTTTTTTATIISSGPLSSDYRSVQDVQPDDTPEDATPLAARTTKIKNNAQQKTTEKKQGTAIPAAVERAAVQKVPSPLVMVSDTNAPDEAPLTTERLTTRTQEATKKQRKQGSAISAAAAVSIVALTAALDLSSPNSPSIRHVVTQESGQERHHRRRRRRSFRILSSLRTHKIHNGKKKMLIQKKKMTTRLAAFQKPPRSMKQAARKIPRRSSGVRSASSGVVPAGSSSFSKSSFSPQPPPTPQPLQALLVISPVYELHTTMTRCAGASCSTPTTTDGRRHEIDNEKENAGTKHSHPSPESLPTASLLENETEDDKDGVGSQESPQFQPQYAYHTTTTYSLAEEEEDYNCYYYNTNNEAGEDFTQPEETQPVSNAVESFDDSHHRDSKNKKDDEEHNTDIAPHTARLTPNRLRSIYTTIEDDDVSQEPTTLSSKPCRTDCSQTVRKKKIQYAATITSNSTAARNSDLAELLMSEEDSLLVSFSSASSLSSVGSVRSEILLVSSDEEENEIEKGETTDDDTDNEDDDEGTKTVCEHISKDKEEEEEEEEEENVSQAFKGLTSSSSETLLEVIVQSPPKIFTKGSIAVVENTESHTGVCYKNDNNNTNTITSGMTVRIVKGRHQGKYGVVLRWKDKRTIQVRLVPIVVGMVTLPSTSAPHTLVNVRRDSVMVVARATPVVDSSLGIRRTTAERGPTITIAPCPQRPRPVRIMAGVYKNRCGIFTSMKTKNTCWVKIGVAASTKRHNTNRNGTSTSIIDNQEVAVRWTSLEFLNTDDTIDSQNETDDNNSLQDPKGTTRDDTKGSVATTARPDDVRDRKWAGKTICIIRGKNKGKVGMVMDRNENGLYKVLLKESSNNTNGRRRSSTSAATIVFVQQASLRLPY